MAHTFISIPFVVAIALIFSCTAYFLVGLKNSGFGYFLLDLSLSLIVAESMVVTISGIVPHLIIGLALGAGFYGMFMLVCGFFVKATNIVSSTDQFLSYFEMLMNIHLFSQAGGSGFTTFPFTNIHLRYI